MRGLLLLHSSHDCSASTCAVYLREELVLVEAIEVPFEGAEDELVVPQLEPRLRAEPSLEPSYGSSYER